MSPERKIRSLTPVALAAAALLAAGCMSGQRSLTRSRIKKAEKGLLRAVTIKGTAPEKLTLADRMAFYRVPGVSVAVIDRYALEWAKGYGVKNLETNDPVTPETLFQGGAFMRPLVSAAILALAEKGRLPREAETSSLLKSWTYPAGKGVPLWDLWVRSTGLPGPAAPGLPRREAVPALSEVTAGRIEAQADARAVAMAAAAQVIEDQAGIPLPAVMDAAVFLPLSMSRSTCAVPLPQEAEVSAASGYLRNGRMAEGGWLNYPVAAADGLWTTPAEYAAFLDGVVGDAMGKSALVLSPASARILLSPTASRGGLGFLHEGAGNDAFFRVQSRTAGFAAVACYFPARGGGAVIMTNSENGGLLAEEILRAIAAAYGWPFFKPEEKPLFRLDPAIIQHYVGSYEIAPDYSLQVRSEDYYLVIEPTGQAPTKFYVENETIFFSIDPFIRIQFRHDQAGRVNGLVLWQEDFEQKAVKIR